MPKNLLIKSLNKNYSVNFISNFKLNLIKSDSENNYYLVDDKIYNLNKSFFIKSQFRDKIITIKSNENSKSIDQVINYGKKLIKLKINKNSLLFVIGGGVIQDIGSFLSSILFRGIEYIFYPTTLLSQCDSCIGSKTSINILSYKNLLGNFWPPKSVFIDHNFLKSLDQPSIKSGIGEMCHYFIYGNINFFKNLISEYDKVLNNPKKIIKYISKSLQIKKKVIEKDEFEKGERKKFNYGHTFGHALEALTNYEMNHGQAVTVGMDMANFLSFRLGNLKENDYFLLRNLLIKNFPDHKMKKYKIKDYIDILRKDKKNKDNKLGCILLDSKNHMNLTYLNFDKNLLKNLEYYFNYFL